MSHLNHYLIIICGPTASAKTECAIRLGEHYGSEILSTDSRQIYKELNIGTAKPSAEELKKVKHHFISTISIMDEYSAGQYERDALGVLAALFQKNNIAITAGGTGLYIRALIEGFDDIPVAPPAVRAAVILDYETYGLTYLQQEVQAADPISYAETDNQNPQRLMRLLEVYRSTGQPRSSFLKKEAKPRSFQIVKIGMQMDREVLYDRINKRVDIMMGNGLLNEVQSFKEYEDFNALQTVGYSELIDYLNGNTSLERAVELIKRNSRRYAKRQMTWFRKDSDIQWFEPTETSAMISFIDKIVNQ